MAGDGNMGETMNTIDKSVADAQAAFYQKKINELCAELARTQLKLDMERATHYLHTDDNYYWTPFGWKEFQDAKVKNGKLREALEFITAECERHIQTLEEKGVTVCVSWTDHANKILAEFGGRT